MAWHDAYDEVVFLSCKLMNVGLDVSVCSVTAGALLLLTSLHVSLQISKLVTEVMLFCVTDCTHVPTL